MTVTGTNNFTGTMKVTWYIDKATLTDNTEDVTATYDGTAKAISLNISGFKGGQNLSNAAGVPPDCNERRGQQDDLLSDHVQ